MNKFVLLVGAALFAVNGAGTMARAEAVSPLSLAPIAYAAIGGVIQDQPASAAKVAEVAVTMTMTYSSGAIQHCWESARATESAPAFGQKLICGQQPQNGYVTSVTVEPQIVAFEPAVIDFTPVTPEWVKDHPYFNRFDLLK